MRTTGLGMRGFLAGTALCLLWGCGAEPATVHAGNPSQIEYLLVLDGHGKPRTSFTPGAHIGYRVEVYAVARTLGGVRSMWALHGPRTVYTWTHSGGFTGPTRGHLFRLTQTAQLAVHSPPGAYVVSISLTVGGRHLSRTARLYVRR